MDQARWWKNFNLGTELDIAGTFVYNGLRVLHEMETLYEEAEIFEAMYQLAVGLERLFKIAVVLIEHDGHEDQDRFEKSLITHNHQSLLRRVQARHDLQLKAPENEFLGILSKFYKTHRYGRYSLSSPDSASPEKRMLHEYIEKHLGVKIHDDFPFDITPNCSRIRKFVGKRIGKICLSLFKVIRGEARRQGIYTYEIRPNSKAEKLFVREEFDFTNEDVLWKELIIFLLNNQEPSAFLAFVRKLEPLDFDTALMVDYMQCFGSERKKLEVLDELESLYEGLENRRRRLEMLDLIANPDVEFDSEEGENKVS